VGVDEGGDGSPAWMAYKRSILMSLCEYCGAKAGRFQSHPACVVMASHMGQTVRKLVFDATLAGKDYEEVSTEIQKSLANGKVQFKYVREPYYKVPTTQQARLL
jgi:hypothetical protein